MLFNNNPGMTSTNTPRSPFDSSKMDYNGGGTIAGRPKPRPTGGLFQPQSSGVSTPTAPGMGGGSFNTNGTLLGTSGPFRPTPADSGSGRTIANPVRPTGMFQAQGSPVGNPITANNGNYQQMNTPSGEPDWGNPDIIRQFFNDRGVSPFSTSPDYWAGKWKEWGWKDPEYFKKFLSNAEEFTGGSHQTAMNMWGNDPAQQQQQQGMGMFQNLIPLIMQLLQGRGMQPNQQMPSSYFQNQGQNQNMDISSLLGRSVGGLGLGGILG